VVDRATIGCFSFSAPHETRFELRKIQNPNIERRVKGQPAQ